MGDVFGKSMKIDLEDTECMPGYMLPVVGIRVEEGMEISPFSHRSVPSPS